MTYVCKGTSLLERAEELSATADKLWQRVTTRNVFRCVCVTLGTVLIGCTWSVPVRLANSGDFLMLPVTANGVATSFLLDTGATNTTVSKQFAGRIGLWSEARPLDAPIETETPQPVLGAHYAVLRSFKLGPIRAKRDSGQVLVVDLSYVSRLVREEVDGLVGNATLGSADYVLNVRRPSLELARTLKLSDSPQAVHLKTSGHRTYLPATINGKSFDFLLDTGSNRSFVTSEVLHTLGDVETDVVERGIISLNALETKSFKRFRAKVTLGDVSVPDFALLIGDGNRIGLDLLRFGELSVSVNEGRFVFRSLDET